MVAITGTELQEWVEHMSRGWKKLLESHPEIVSFPCDIRETTSVAQLLQHIVAVELRYAERLNELPQTHTNRFRMTRSTPSSRLTAALWICCGR